MIYLDTAATAIPEEEAIADIEYAMRNLWYNPSNSYKESVQVKDELIKTKEIIKDFLNLPGDHEANECIYFLSSGSQVNNWILSMAKKESMRIISSKTEHPSIVKMKPDIFLKHLSTGEINIYHLEEQLEYINKFREIPFVSVSLVNNETGVINDIRKIASLVHEYGGWIHTDLSQAIGHAIVDLSYYSVDLATFTSEKIGLPRGLGVAYISPNFPKSSWVVGGNQENGLVAGTENQYLPYALQGVLQRIKKDYFWRIRKEIKLYRQIVYGIIEIANKYNIYTEINLKYLLRVKNIISIWFQGISGMQLVSLLNEKNILLSTGSACHSGDNNPSEQLLAFGISPEKAEETIRISFDWRLTFDDVKQFLFMLDILFQLLKE